MQILRLSSCGTKRPNAKNFKQFKGKGRREKGHVRHRNLQLYKTLGTCWRTTKTAVTPIFFPHFWTKRFVFTAPHCHISKDLRLPGLFNWILRQVESREDGPRLNKANTDPTLDMRDYEGNMEMLRCRKSTIMFKPIAVLFPSKFQSPASTHRMRELDDSRLFCKPSKSTSFPIYFTVLKKKSSKQPFWNLMANTKHF